MNTELKNDAVPHDQEPLSPDKRLLLFLATYILGSIIFIGIAVDWPNALPRHPDFPVPPARALAEWLDFFGEYLIVLFGTLIYLPMGLGWFPILHDHPVSTLLFALSYISTFLTLFIGSATKKRRTFRVLYFIFIALVIMNVAGCLSDVPDVL